VSRHVASDKRPIVLDMTIVKNCSADALKSKYSARSMMSHEGMMFVIRGALVIVLIVAAHSSVRWSDATGDRASSWASGRLVAWRSVWQSPQWCPVGFTSICRRFLPPLVS
jgi:hypothetical protein